MNCEHQWVSARNVVVKNGSVCMKCRCTAQPAQEPRTQWDDPRVQQVYAILCSPDEPPEQEHWEGFAARRIVDALFGAQPAKQPVLRDLSDEDVRKACAVVLRSDYADLQEYDLAIARAVLAAARKP